MSHIVVCLDNRTEAMLVRLALDAHDIESIAPGSTATVQRSSARCASNTAGANG